MRKIYMLILFIVFAFTFSSVKAANVLNPIDKAVKVIGKDEVIDDIEFDFLEIHVIEEDDIY